MFGVGEEGLTVSSIRRFIGGRFLAIVLFDFCTLRHDVVGSGLKISFELPPAASLIFAPGGYHLMLMNPKRTLRAGDPVVIKLEFRGGLVLPVAYEVRK